MSRPSHGWVAWWWPPHRYYATKLFLIIQQQKYLCTKFIPCFDILKPWHSCYIFDLLCNIVVFQAYSLYHCTQRYLYAMTNAYNVCNIVLYNDCIDEESIHLSCKYKKLFRSRFKTFKTFVLGCEKSSWPSLACDVCPTFFDFDFMVEDIKGFHQCQRPAMYCRERENIDCM